MYPYGSERCRDDEAITLKVWKVPTVTTRTRGGIKNWKCREEKESELTNFRGDTLLAVSCLW